jgi:signal peptidase I
VRGSVRAAIWLGAILGAVALLLHLFVFDTWAVPRADAQLGASVLPALKPDDLILLRKGSSPSYGELARCASPLVSGAYVVGRVFGVAGDRVEVSDFTVVTSGRGISARHGCPAMTVPHPVTGELMTLNCGVAETGAWNFEYLTSPEVNGGQHSALVESGKVYLVSDNRLMHQDSRDFGQVDVSTCQHIVYRLWGEQFTDSSRRFTILW